MCEASVADLLMLARAQRGSGLRLLLHQKPHWSHRFELGSCSRSWDRSDLRVSSNLVEESAACRFMICNRIGLFVGLHPDLGGKTHTSIRTMQPLVTE